jgi:hypothetical protein
VAEANAAFYQHTKFASLHERRVKVLSELFDLLVRSEVAFEACFNSDDQDRAEPMIIRLRSGPLRAAVRARNTLSEYFNSNRIWVPVSVCILMDTLLSVRWTLSERVDPDSESGQFTHMRAVAWQEFQKQFTRLRGEIESEVRRILEVLEPPSIYDVHATEESLK